MTILSKFRPISMVIIFFVILSSCAKPFSKIPPDPKGANSFAGITCDLAIIEKDMLREKLTYLSKAQKKKVTQDIVTIALIGIPTSGGGFNKEIAKTKAESDIIDKKITSCQNGKIVSAPPPIHKN